MSIDLSKLLNSEEAELIQPANEPGLLPLHRVKGLVDQIIHKMKCGDYLTSRAPEQELQYKEQNVVIAHLDTFHSYACIIRNYSEDLAGYFGSLSVRAFIRSGGVRKWNIPIYRGVWIVPEESLEHVVEALRSKTVQYEFITPQWREKIPEQNNSAFFNNCIYPGTDKHFKGSSVDP